MSRFLLTLTVLVLTAAPGEYYTALFEIIRTDNIAAAVLVNMHRVPVCDSVHSYIKQEILQLVVSSSCPYLMLFPLN